MNDPLTDATKSLRALSEVLKLTQEAVDRVQGEVDLLWQIRACIGRADSAAFDLLQSELSRLKDIHQSLSTPT